jgi:hypothetical protein
MIAYRPEKKGGHMSNDVINLAMQRHPDGFGIAWRERGMVQSRRFAPTNRGKKQFKNLVERVDRTGREYVAHFRWATHGAEDAAHAHPYAYMDPDPSVGPVYVFHNGIIDVQTSGAESDTEVFVRDYLTHLPSRWWTNQAIVNMMTEFIGWSKITLMTNEETINLHASRGDWDGGVWYSSTHKPYPYTYTQHSGMGSWESSTDTGSWGSSGKGFEDAEWDNETGQRHTYRKTSGALVTGWYDAKKKTWNEEPASEAEVAEYLSVLPESRAMQAARTFGMMDEPEAVSRDVDQAQRFRHAGHFVSAIRYIDTLGPDHEYTDALLCDNCRTVGSAYVIERTLFIDMPHMDDNAVDEEAEAERRDFVEAGLA